MSVLGSFAFRDMVIEVEELVSTDFNILDLWLHRIYDGYRETVVVHRDGLSRGNAAGPLETRCIHG